MSVTTNCVANPSLKSGFTLIELSIVLVVIGLIVGGILVGQDLIRAAGVRAQITQLERYNTAVNTFRGKYGYLPGDIPDPAASQFGFVARGPNPGEGDGNGILEGYNGTSNTGYAVCCENMLFWTDLTKAGLIDQSFNTAVASFSGSISGTTLNAYFPQAKLGRSNYIYTYSVYGQNYFTISQISNISSGGSIVPSSSIGITVKEAYNIDTKLDDGLPVSGRIMSIYLNSGSTPPLVYAPSSVNGQFVGNYVPPSAAGYQYSAPAGPPLNVDQGSSSTCFDRSISPDGQTTNPVNEYPWTPDVVQQYRYSIEMNGGAGTNCALSIRFQ